MWQYFISIQCRALYVANVSHREASITKISIQVVLLFYCKCEGRGPDLCKEIKLLHINFANTTAP
jgi:hypothetical protein